ncbi:GlxA family transcriptional regulator [Streptomyces ovatisporus]|uniref:GlxA family transcriptional regulator n=1 Tax=Streptomyces ovatisporus TaxID=1128682 RepID=A0ABV9A0K3_9ACTN
MLKNVAVALTHGVNAFELGVAAEVFGMDRSDQGLPVHDFALVAAEPPPIRANPPFTIDALHGIDRLADADLIVVPAGQGYQERDFPEELLAALRAAVDRGAWVLSVCSGAFLLGAAGLLDGRRCTAHWRDTEQLSRRFPRARVEPGVLYVEDASVITSAGTAAGIDACLHLVRREQGSHVANAIARRMVVPPHREGGQAQYIEHPVPPERGDDAIGVSLHWLEEHLTEQITVEQLAGMAHMAPRTYARRFQQETGTTPHQWVLGQRILRAQHLLEETDLTVDAIAARAGFGNDAALRHHFLRRLGTTPNAYRRTFRGPPARVAGADHGRTGGEYEERRAPGALGQ